MNLKSNTMRLTKTASWTQSIKEMRQIHANLTDYQFAKWYSGRYPVDFKDVMSLIKPNKGGDNA